MRKVDEYYDLITKIGYIDLEASSIADSRRIISELNEREQALLEIKKSLIRDIRNFEAYCLEERMKIREKYTSGKGAGIIGKVKGNSMSKEIRKLELGKKERIEAYLELKYMVDELLLEMEKARGPLNNYLKRRLGL